ncbi:M1 family metallopeptidase [uncultured Dokdonia sp.]|uniref:M1 family metallopeptidase n=1 Tax=uncultured Dokdonia sp. TaxID=575653 RepID=UPI0026254A3A|nr:M1 family metallopeptidase [uncultured Dokdonia sp.]
MKYLPFVLLYTSLSVFGQKYNRQDTLQGSVTPQRAWWDLNHYDLSVDVNPDTQFIIGKNTMTYTVLEEGMDELQIDLQAPMKLNLISQDGIALEVRHEGNAHFVQLREKQKKGTTHTLTMGFEGKPRKAKNAPWDGGFSWKKDAKGRHFIATSNQGIGASVWWPNKDHPYDEVDSLDMHVTVPKDLVDVSNGRLVSVDTTATSKTYHWTVKNPINSYGVNLNIGYYTHFKEVYQGEKGPLDMDYWVIEGNEEKAREQFKQAPMMMKAFEHWFGPYPFYKDGYKLVEVPYLGMEHQSSVTYGNNYKNGYLGRDLSKTGWGLKFDFIIIHESGHEWFANNITNKDVADMWIHESFTSYSENLYLDYYFGKEASAEYVIGLRKNIRNDRPIIGTYGVRETGSESDIYYKGSNMLHTLRTLVEDDELWRNTLRGLNAEFCHQTVTTKQIETYLSKKLRKDLSAFFDQYLRTTDIPVLEYQKLQNKITFRYSNVVTGFDMPLQMIINGKKEWIYPSTQWRTFKGDARIKDMKIADDFYIELRKINP